MRWTLTHLLRADRRRVTPRGPWLLATLLSLAALGWPGPALAMSESSLTSRPLGPLLIAESEADLAYAPSTPRAAGRLDGHPLLAAPARLPTPVADAPPRLSLRCPMLYYHEIPSQSQFEVQLVALLEAGFRPTTMGRLVAAFEGRADSPPGCLVLSFDDALFSQITGALPVLQRYMCPATFFVMPAFQDGVHRYMTANDFVTLRDSGMELASHSLNHPNLTALLRLNVGAFQSELVNSKTAIEALLGKPIDLFAYPNGAWDQATAEQVRLAGYRAAASTLAGTVQRSEERFWLRRLPANPGESPARVLARLAQ